MQLAEYIICKNELKHLDAWLKELIKLDIICILDTGSTDGTYEKLLELEKQYSNIHIRQKTYNPFYFDDARNDALDFVKEYVQEGDWLFTLDLDEYVSSNFVDIVRPQLESAIDAEAICLLDHTGCWHWQGHRYRSNYKWFYHIHETILTTDGKEIDSNVYLQDVHYYHNQDLSKPRNYRKILTQMVKENPNCLHYLVNSFDEEHNAPDADQNYVDWLRRQIVDNVMNNKQDVHYHDYAYLIFASQDIYCHGYYAYSQEVKDNLEELCNIFHIVEKDIDAKNYTDSRSLHLTYIDILQKLSNPNNFSKIEEEFLRALTLKTDLGWWLERGNTIESILLKFVMWLFYDKHDTIAAAFYAQQLYLLQPNEMNTQNTLICQPYNQNYRIIMGDNKNINDIVKEIEELKKLSDNEDISLIISKPLSVEEIQILLNMDIHILFCVKEYYNEKV